MADSSDSSEEATPDGREAPDGVIDLEGCRAALEAINSDSESDISGRLGSPDHLQLNYIKTLDGWLYLWLVSWCGTMIAGGAFGAICGGLMAGVAGIFAGAIIGCIYVAFVGLLTVTSVIAGAWMLWLHRHPVAIACACGIVTGCVCGIVLFPITGILGGVGGYRGGLKFIQASPLRDWGPIVPGRDKEPSKITNFSLADLFFRMTVFAVLLTIWLTVFRLALSSSSPF